MPTIVPMSGDPNKEGRNIVSEILQTIRVTLETMWDQDCCVMIGVVIGVISLGCLFTIALIIGN